MLRRFSYHNYTLKLCQNHVSRQQSILCKCAFVDLFLNGALGQRARFIILYYNAMPNAPSSFDSYIITEHCDIDKHKKYFRSKQRQQTEKSFLILLGLSKRSHYHGGVTAMIWKRKGRDRRCLQKDDNHINPGRQSRQQTMRAQAAIQYIPTHAWRGTLRRNIFHPISV